MEPTYTPEFWRRAYNLHDEPYKQCSQCKRVHRTASPSRVIVRVVCLTPDTPTPESLDLRCTQCHPDSRTLTIPRKVILSRIGLLFPEMLPKKVAKHA